MLPDDANAPQGPEQHAATPLPPTERLAKRMARAGLCSRREAEAWILAGRVTVNGAAVLTPACGVTAQDTVRVDGAPLPDAETPRLWRYHKPRGLLTTHRDPQGRPTVFAHLPPELAAHTHRILSVGRLDLHSEGLLLLTNHSGLATTLMQPARPGHPGLARVYRVRTFGIPTPEVIAALAAGVTVEGITYGPVRVRVSPPRDTDPHTRANVWLTVTLTEGKNREIRRLMDHYGHPVSRLIRVRYGPFPLDDLPPGTAEEIPRAEFQRFFVG